jgi:hypothetical protein
MDETYVIVLVSFMLAALTKRSPSFAGPHQIANTNPTMKQIIWGILFICSPFFFPSNLAKYSPTFLIHMGWVHPIELLSTLRKFMYKTPHFSQDRKRSMERWKEDDGSAGY